jgi:putative tryptophan/tyrosine transport system substrate-binding protein
MGLAFPGKRVGAGMAFGRRAFITLAGGVLMARPQAAAAQPRTPRRIALVHSGIPADKLTETGGTFWVRRFHEELRALGYREGGNLVIERFSAEGDARRFAAVAADIASRKPDIIISNSNPLLKVLMETAPTTPIVGIMGNPVAAGLVSNIARPGGTLTGVSIDAGPGIAAKRVQILKEAVPGAAKIAYLLNSLAEEQRSGVSLPTRMLAEVNEATLRRAFADMTDEKVDAALVSEDGSFLARRALIVELAVQHRIPAIYAYREYAEAGGLLSYGPELSDLAKRMANDVQQILGGTKPGDIPIYLPTKYELVLNLKTAKALDLTIPQSVLAQADEVIE